jgi:DNA-directed RNA polymerase sigma subunit (sigma70/sigma32)
VTLGEMLPAPECDVADIVERNMLHASLREHIGELLNPLKKQHRLIVLLRYLGGQGAGTTWTQQEIATRFKCTHQSISAKEATALRAIKRSETFRRLFTDEPPVKVRSRRRRR